MNVSVLFFIIVFSFHIGVLLYIFQQTNGLIVKDLIEVSIMSLSISDTVVNTPTVVNGPNPVNPESCLYEDFDVLSGEHRQAFGLEPSGVADNVESVLESSMTAEMFRRSQTVAKWPVALMEIFTLGLVAVAALPLGIAGTLIVSLLYLIWHPWLRYTTVPVFIDGHPFRTFDEYRATFND